MLTAPVGSSAADQGGIRRRLVWADARREPAAVRSGRSALTLWSMVLVALGAFIGALACANSAAASSHDHSTSQSTVRSASIVESSSDENTARSHSAGHGAHRSIDRSPVDAPTTEGVVGHPGLACVVAIDLTCQLVAGVLVAGPPVAAVAPMFAEYHHEPDSPVPRCSAVLAS